MCQSRCGAESCFHGASMSSSLSCTFHDLNVHHSSFIGLSVSIHPIKFVDSLIECILIGFITVLSIVI